MLIMDTIKKQNWLFIVTALIVGIIIGVGIQGYLPQGSTSSAGERAQTQESDNGSGTQTSAGSLPPVMEKAGGSLTVTDQPAGRAVVVDNAYLQKVGWVVVHEMVGDKLGNALGASRREAGVSTRVVVELLRGTEPGNRYAVVLYGDNGNRTFELHDDPQLADEDGLIMATFTAKVPTAPAGN